MHDPTTTSGTGKFARQAILAWSVLIAALAAFAYRDSITADFTGGDTVALIQVSLIHSLADVGRVLTQPMLPILTKFYRPTAALSYALDDALWGFDAFGSHVTDVAIHAGVCALIVLVVHRFSRSTTAAVIAGLAFALHPIVMESVPTATRRQDTLAGLFMLLTLYWLPRGNHGRARAVALIPSLVACLLALGAKEGSVILPALVFALELALVAEPPDARPRWVQALRRAAPFVVLTGLFVAWRAWILGGAGGNEYSWKWTQASIPALGENTCNFFADLVHPLRVIFHPYLSGTDRGIAVCLAIILLVLVPALVRASGAVGTSASPAPSSRLLLRLLLVILCAILIFPAVSWWIRGAIEQAYRNEAWPALARLIGTPHKQPVEFYVWKVFELAMFAATGALILVSALLAIAWARKRSSAQSETPRPRLMLFAAAWSLLHLGLFLAVQRYHAWNAYVPAIPFCIFVGLAFAEGLRSGRVQAIALGVFVAWLVCWSPLVRNFDVWTANGKFNSMLMTEMARIAEQAPSGSTLEFYDLPNMNRSWQLRGPEPTSVFTINQASMVAWIHREAPKKNLRVELRTNLPTQWPIAGLRMDMEPLEPPRVAVRTRVLPIQPGG